MFPNLAVSMLLLLQARLFFVFSSPVDFILLKLFLTRLSVTELGDCPGVPQLVARFLSPPSAKRFIGWWFLEHQKKRSFGVFSTPVHYKKHPEKHLQAQSRSELSAPYVSTRSAQGAALTSGVWRVLGLPREATSQERRPQTGGAMQAPIHIGRSLPRWGFG